MKNRGMTLLEVMIVLTIIVTLAALSLPIMDSALSNSRLRASADTVRAEWAKLRIKAMEDGQIYCFRCSLDGDRILIDRVLDVHFTAGLTSTASSDIIGYKDSMDASDDYLSEETGNLGFERSEDDFLLRDPSEATEETGARFVTLEGGSSFSDALAVPDERTAYLLGSPIEDMEGGRGSVDQDQIKNRDGRYGETVGNDGKTWSAPIFFFPDGTTSTAAVLLKNDKDRCIEVRIRGLTGSTTVGEIYSSENYEGDLVFQ